MINKTVQIFLAGMILLLYVSVAHAGAYGKMSEFSLPSALDGKDVASKDFDGKVLLITFFATWCPPCRQEVPTLIKLQNEYGSKGFSVIGMSVDEKGPKVVVKMINKDKINYPVLMVRGKTARDFGGITGIPTSFLVNRQGMIIKHYPGYVPHSLLKKDIQGIL
jgi:thiol-disulfide isomerase/thioredoxin